MQCCCSIQDDKHNDVFSGSSLNAMSPNVSARSPLVLLLDGACFAAWQASHSLRMFPKRFWQVKRTSSESKLVGIHVMMLEVELLSTLLDWTVADGFCLRQVEAMWPFILVVLSAADPEPASPPLGEFVRAGEDDLPFHMFTIGLISWDVVRLQLSSSII